MRTVERDREAAWGLGHGTEAVKSAQDRNMWRRLVHSHNIHQENRHQVKQVIYMYEYVT